MESKKNYTNPIPYNEVEIIERESVKFGDEVLDGFISEDGGVELGTMIALAGTPGAGKTTLCKKLQKDLKKGEKSVFFALESRSSSVVKQTKRIDTGKDELIGDVTNFPTWSSFKEYLYDKKPLLTIVDSLQHAASLLSEENKKYKYENYKTIIKDLYEWKDITQGIVILIVQLSSDGSVEGPMSTIFDVDCPIFLTADADSNERTMHTDKNRMGPIGKIYYEFVETEECIKFHTTEQWNSLKNKGESDDYLTKVIKDTETYISTLDKKDEKVKSLIKEYKANIKKIETIENDVDYLTEYVKMNFLLMNKYGL